MNILIYEDNFEDLKVLEKCIINFFEEKDIEYTLDTCNDPDYVLKYHLIYDLIFLDIEVKKENGIDLACFIRTQNKNVCLIFISNYSKYLIDGYKAQAYRYFLKPIEQEEFNLEMQNVISDCLEDYDGFFDKRIFNRKIYYKDIIYFEYNFRKTYIHFLSGEVIAVACPLKFWLTRLPKIFAQPYKAFIVNLKYVKKISKSQIKVEDDKILPLSRKFKKEFENKYIEYLRIK